MTLDRALPEAQEVDRPRMDSHEVRFSLAPLRIPDHRDSLTSMEALPEPRWIPQSYDRLGFPQGIGGRELLSQLRTHALQYGAVIRQGTGGAYGGRSPP